MVSLMYIETAKIGKIPVDMEFVDKKVEMKDLISLSKGIPTVTVDNDQAIEDQMDPELYCGPMLGYSDNNGGKKRPV